MLLLPLNSVDGNWSDWNDWSECPVTCGGGVQNRSRTCTNPPPAFGGNSCPGESDETRPCNEKPCPGIHTHHCSQTIFFKFCVVIAFHQFFSIIPELNEVKLD